MLKIESSSFVSFINFCKHKFREREKLYLKGGRVYSENEKCFSIRKIHSQISQSIIKSESFRYFLSD